MRLDVLSENAESPTSSSNSYLRPPPPAPTVPAYEDLLLSFQKSLAFDRRMLLQEQGE